MRCLNVELLRAGATHELWGLLEVSGRSPRGWSRTRDCWREPLPRRLALALELGRVRCGVVLG